MIRAGTDAAVADLAATRTDAPPAPRTATERRIADDVVSRKVLVTGAGGFLGCHVVAALHRCGAEVRALVRDDGHMPRVLTLQAEVVVGNLIKPDTVRRAMEGIDIVVHCAAVVTTPTGAKMLTGSNGLWRIRAVITGSFSMALPDPHLVD